MEFRKYQHIERFGSTETEGIEVGECLVFPKIDGSNTQLYLDDHGELKAGSRNRELTLDSDHAGFFAWAQQQQNIKGYLDKHPTHRLFGEWLVKHTLKTYRDDAWRRFYIFDVCIDKEDGDIEYVPYDTYKPLLDEFNLDYIPPLAKIVNARYEQFIRCLEQNIFLIKDGQGVGEGIVIKNYDFYNKFGRQVWAKIVTSEFKEKHMKTMGAPTIQNAETVEQQIASAHVSSALVEKEFAKIVTERGGWNNKYIPELLSKVWYCLITEEMWDIVKEHKNPTINFKILNKLVINRIKEVKSDIF